MRTLSLPFLTLPLFLACGGPESPLEGEPELAEADAALDGACGSTHHWRQDPGWAKKLEPASSHVCFLSAVGGGFGADDRGVLLSVDGYDGHWWLGGSGAPSGLWAEARCVRKSCVQATGDARWTSSEFTASERGQYCDSAYSTATAWWGDAVTFLTGVKGKFAGARESVEVWQYGSGTYPSSLAVNSCQSSGTVRGYARSFFAGTPSSGRAARFQGPYGIGTSREAGEYFASSKSGAGATEMAPTASSMCVLTRVSGKFVYSSDFVQIRPQLNANGVEVWALGAYGSSGDGTIAKARCYLLDQR